MTVRLLYHTLRTLNVFQEKTICHTWIPNESIIMQPDIVWNMLFLLLDHRQRLRKSFYLADLKVIKLLLQQVTLSKAIIKVLPLLLELLLSIQLLQLLHKCHLLLGKDVILENKLHPR